MCAPEDDSITQVTLPKVIRLQENDDCCAPEDDV